MKRQLTAICFISLHSEAAEDVHANTHATSTVKTMTKVPRTGNGVPPPTSVTPKSWQSGNTAGELEWESGSDSELESGSEEKRSWEDKSHKTMKKDFFLFWLD